MTPPPECAPYIVPPFVLVLWTVACLVIGAVIGAIVTKPYDKEKP